MLDTEADSDGDFEADVDGVTLNVADAVDDAPREPDTEGVADTEDEIDTVGVMEAGCADFEAERLAEGDGELEEDTEPLGVPETDLDAVDDCEALGEVDDVIDGGLLWEVELDFEPDVDAVAL